MIYIIKYKGNNISIEDWDSISIQDNMCTKVKVGSLGWGRYTKREELKYVESIHDIDMKEIYSNGKYPTTETLNLYDTLCKYFVEARNG